MITMVILGGGNVAQHIAKAFATSTEVQVVQMYNRKGVSFQSIPVTQNLSDLVEADIYLLAVSDDAIEDIAHQIPHTQPLVVHTSGSVSIEALSSHKRRGVMYPLQTFSKDRSLDYSTIPWCLEANNDSDYQLLEYITKSISTSFYSIDSEKRKKLHLAAVFVCNFVNHLYQMGYEITEENDIPFDILQPLIQETAAKVTQGTPRDMQTGPAKRNDQKTMQKHLEMLALPEKKEIYQILSNAIAQTHGRKEL